MRAVRLWLHELGAASSRPIRRGWWSSSSGLIGSGPPGRRAVVAGAGPPGPPRRRRPADGAHRGGVERAPPEPRPAARGDPARLGWRWTRSAAPAERRPAAAAVRGDGARPHPGRPVRSARARARARACASGRPARSPTRFATGASPRSSPLAHGELVAAAATSLREPSASAADQLGLGGHELGRIYAGLARGRGPPRAQRARAAPRAPRRASSRPPMRATA